MKKNNRKLRKLLLVTCCALALAAISVGATLAYLTDTEAVTNVFTVGKVGITLDEAKTDTDGVKILDGNNEEIRISGNRGDNEQYTNKYHLIPSKTYTKDPTVHVNADSEDSYIFVKVENGIAGIEAEGNTIAAQIAVNGWTKLEGVDNVYYQVYTKNQTDRDLEVFASFTLKGEGLVNGEAGAGEVSIDGYGTATVNVTAYAIQKFGFADANAAWTAGKTQNTDWN